MSTKIRTFTGILFDPLNPCVEDIKIQDIAHALSHVCRFTGHVSHFYSVAEHSIRVAERLPKELQLAGLLHDASEAYISDVSSPLKHSEGFARYREIEAVLQEVIYNRFGVRNGYDPKVKEADAWALGEETKYLVEKKPWTETRAVNNNIRAMYAMANSYQDEYSNAVAHRRYLGQLDPCTETIHHFKRVEKPKDKFLELFLKYS
jgi:5'-deoxynucleotidase YfbR-like HD superfamily hydrolase